MGLRVRWLSTISVHAANDVLMNTTDIFVVCTVIGQKCHKSVIIATLNYRIIELTLTIILILTRTVMTPQ